mmetsp:Transcript_86158/g.244032  ORF Transcript_86158/g.244032 Transcript_86158/m.244032 type:complete len:225 (+) Transcript_86158:788-1462(+)
MVFVSSSIVILRSSILASTSAFSRSLRSLWSWFWLNSSTQKSLCLISAAFSSWSCAIMSSMAFLTRSNASIRTRTARDDKRGLCNLRATSSSSLEARSRRAEWAAAALCTNATPAPLAAPAGLKVLVKRSCASSPLRTAMALDTASISWLRVFWRASHSWSVIWHFSLSTIRNCSSAESAALVSSMSSLLCARRSSVSASSWVFLSTCAWPAWISACLAALRSS